MRREMHSSVEIEDEDEEQNGGSWFSRTFNKWRGMPDEEDYDDAPPVPQPAPRGGSGHGARAYAGPIGGGGGAPAAAAARQTFRIASARESTITVMPVMNFADIQRAADRLKTGEPQIINLEKTPAEVSERLIDFLNGVTYAMDGYVEKISEGAYLFTPSHITIQAEGSEPPQPKPFFDR
jgi:FtsZ-interacting cell division protein YlmF